MEGKTEVKETFQCDGVAVQVEVPVETTKEGSESKDAAETSQGSPTVNLARRITKKVVDTLNSPVPDDCGPEDSWGE